MNRPATLARRLEEVLLNGRWIANTNIASELKRLSWEQATHHIGESNSIAALTYHLTYYLAGFIDVLNGGALEMRDQYSWDMSPVESEADWQELVARFLKHSETFVKKVRQMQASQLDELFFEEQYGTYLRNIDGVIEHSYYHLGQMVLLRRMIESQG